MANIISLKNNDTGLYFRNSINSNFSALNLNKSEIDHTHDGDYATTADIATTNNNVTTNTNDIIALEARIAALEALVL